MTSFFIGSCLELPESLLVKLWCYRYEIFIRELGWNVPVPSHTPPGQERDRFDTDYTVYVIATHANGSIAGCARLLRTTRPYLMQDVFASLLDREAPRSPTVWELSRFAADRGAGAEVFARSLRAAADLGARRVVGVMSRSVEVLCRRYGVPTRRLGAPRRIAAETLVACSAELVQRSRASAFPDGGSRVCELRVSQ